MKASGSFSAFVPRLLLDEITHSCFCFCSRLTGGVGATRHVTLGIMVSCDIAKTDQW